LFFSHCYLAHHYLHSFPTRRSSDLIREEESARASPAIGKIDGPDVDVLFLRAFSRGIEVRARREIPAEIVNSRRNEKDGTPVRRSEEHTSELQSRFDLVCRLLLEKK